MRCKSLFFITLMYMILCQLSFSAAPLFSHPDITVDGDAAYDFGLVRTNEKPTHDFTITNDGDQTLLINSIRTTCGCTKAQILHDTLIPGESSTLVVTFDPQGRTGVQKQIIYVATNDPLEPITVFIITAEVSIPPGPHIIYTPSEWDFGIAEQNASLSKNLIISNSGINGLEIFNIQSPPDVKIHFDFDTSIESGEERTMTLSLNKFSQAGVYERYVHFDTNDIAVPHVTLALHGYVIGTLPPRLEYVPAVWDIGIVRMKPGSPPFVKVLLFNTGEQVLKIDSIDLPEECSVDCSFPILIEKGKNAEINLFLSDLSAPGVFVKDVLIYANDSRHTHSIQIRGYISSSQD